MGDRVLRAMLETWRPQPHPERHRGIGRRRASVGLRQQGLSARPPARGRHAGARRACPEARVPGPVCQIALGRNAERELDWIWKRLGRVALAVRSSGGGEDGENHSFAGVFESVTHVGRAGLEAAIVRVAGVVRGRAGFELPALGRRRQHAGPAHGRCGVSGVLFTRDPSAGGLAMVEMVDGTAENLVSGTARPQSFRFGRVTKKQFGDGARADRSRAAARARRPGRSAVRPAAGHRMDLSRRQLLPRAEPRHHALGCGRCRRGRACRTTSPAPWNGPKARRPTKSSSRKNELSEMLPRPTPLSLSLMEALWAAAAASISPRASSGSPIGSRRARNYLDDHSRPALHRQARGARARAGHRTAGVRAGCVRDGRSHRARFPRSFPAAVLRRKRG